MNRILLRSIAILSLIACTVCAMPPPEKPTRIVVEAINANDLFDKDTYKKEGVHASTFSYPIKTDVLRKECNKLLTAVNDKLNGQHVHADLKFNDNVAVIRAYIFDVQDHEKSSRKYYPFYEIYLPLVNEARIYYSNNNPVTDNIQKRLLTQRIIAIRDLIQDKKAELITPLQDTLAHEERSSATKLKQTMHQLFANARSITYYNMANVLAEQIITQLRLEEKIMNLFVPAEIVTLQAQIDHLQEEQRGGQKLLAVVNTVSDQNFLENYKKMLKAQ